MIKPKNSMKQFIYLLLALVVAFVVVGMVGDKYSF